MALEFSPFAYGAVGDGIADDRSAVLQASQAAVAVKGRLLLENGIFRIGSNVTLDARLRLESGILRPDSAVNVTLTGTCIGDPIQAFDVSAGGSIIGGPIFGDHVYAEWWGAQTGGAVDCQASIQAALNFLMQYIGADGDTLSGRGGKLKLLTGTYLSAAALAMDSGRGITIEGAGKFSTRLLGDMASGMYDQLLIQGIGSASSDYGPIVQGMQFDTGTDTPVSTGSSAQVKIVNTRDVRVMECCFRRPFRAITLQDNAASGAAWIDHNHFIAPQNDNPAPSKSFFIGTVSTGAGQRNSGVRIEHNVGHGTVPVGTNNSMQQCVYLSGGCDQFWSANNHWVGGETAVLRILADQSNNTGNLRFVADAYETFDLTPNCIRIEGNGTSKQVRRVDFVGCLTYGSKDAAILVDAPLARDIVFAAGTSHQAQRHLFHLKQGDAITIGNYTLSTANKAGVSSIYGVLIEGATGVQIENLSYRADTTDNNVAAAVRGKSGKARLRGLFASKADVATVIDAGQSGNFSFNEVNPV